MSGFLSSLKSLAVGATNAANYEEGDESKMHLYELTPQPGESGFTQWLDAMKKCARLPGGIPADFRKQLWLTLAERHLEQRKVDWKETEKMCFNERISQVDEKIGTQIVKDLHRTGCSLFCGAAGRDNQVVLRRVLLGFARWNQSVGYCQGLNVLAALILQVTDRAEVLALKIMIYLIEGVLPEGYYADNLRGLSVDMAVFCDLMRMKLPKLSKHLEALQNDNKDKAIGRSYEPPLTNVFTMQWFLTLFCHCLPQKTVFRIWDLIYLEGSDILLKTSIAIWEEISNRVMTVTSADEFYSIMGVLTREMLEITDTNNLITTIINMRPLHGVIDLREKHRNNITPWAKPFSDNDETDAEEDNRLEITTPIFGISQRSSKNRIFQQLNPIHDKEKLALDINTLKQQYAKLRERQRQAHIILSVAVSKPSVVATSTSQAMNHLLVGKGTLVNAKPRQSNPLSSAISPKVHVRSVPLNWKHQKNVKELPKDESLSSKPIMENAISHEIESSLPKSPESIGSKYLRDDSADSDSGSGSTELCDDPDRLSDSGDDQTSMSDCYVFSYDDNNSLYSSRNIMGSKVPTNQPDLSHHLTDNGGELVSSLTKITSQIGKLSEENSDNFSIKILPVNDGEFIHKFQSITELEELKKSLNQGMSSVIDENEFLSNENTFDSKNNILDENNVIFRSNEKNKENVSKEVEDKFKVEKSDFLVSKHVYSLSNYSKDNFTKNKNYETSYVVNESILSPQLLVDKNSYELREKSIDMRNTDYSKFTDNEIQNTSINNLSDEKISKSNSNSKYSHQLLMQFDSFERKENEQLDSLVKLSKPAFEYNWDSCIEEPKENGKKNKKDEEKKRFQLDSVQALLCRPRCSIPMTVDSLLTDSFIGNERDNLLDQSPNIAKTVSPFHSIFNPDLEMMTEKNNLISLETQLTKSTPQSMFEKENNSDDSSRLSTDLRLGSHLSDEFIQLKSDNEIPVRIDGEIFDRKNYKSIYLIDNNTSVSKKIDSEEGHSFEKVASDTSSNSPGICKNFIKDFTKDRESGKCLEKSWTSLDRQFNNKKYSNQLKEITTIQKCSSDILEDLRHLEISESDGIKIRKNGRDWNDLKSLEARRQDTFSDSSSSFSRDDLKFKIKKTYKIHPKINIDENSDSILNNYSKSLGSMEDDDGEESKLGVWTKVKPRKQGENRRNSDRALKIIQENSVILHKILTGQARKSISDLEDISEEITISPINEEISKIFSPLFEQMGLNEHEINEKLSRIDFDNFDQMKLTAGSEFDAKINDELSKLSLIDDNEIMNTVDLDDMLTNDSSATREARIDQQINDELSKLSASYDIEGTKFNIDSLQSITSASPNTNELDIFDLSSTSTNVFSLETPSFFNEIIKNDYDLIQDSSTFSSKYQSIYTGDPHDFNVTIKKKDFPFLSAKSNLDIHNELEKLSKLSSSNIISPNQHSVASVSNMPHIFTKNYSPQTDSEFVGIGSLQSSINSQPKTFDYLDEIQTYVKSPLHQSIYEIDDNRCKSEVNQPILSKETLEFRIKYGFENQSSDSKSDYLANRLVRKKYYMNDSSVPMLHHCPIIKNDEMLFDSYNSSNCAKYVSDKVNGIDRKIEDDETSPNCKISQNDIVGVIMSPLTSALSITFPNEIVEKPIIYQNIHDPTENLKECKKSSTRLIGVSGSMTSHDCSAIDSSKNNFSPFPKRSITRKPNELGLKLGLYSPSSSNINESKRA